MSRARAESIVNAANSSGDGGEAAESLQRCLVFCRLRPTKALDSIGQDGIYKLVDLHKGKVKVDGEKEYNFDGTFNPDCTQEDIFQDVAKPSIEHVLKGYTAAIMAYGQTGTGKSFTMSHTAPGYEGIIPRSAGYLFDLIEKTTSKKFTLTANFVQIYRDTLSDLMQEKGEKVDVRFDQKKGVEIVNCTLVDVQNKQAFLDMYSEGDARRIVRPTNMNPESSRGHTALVLYVRSEPTDPGDISKPTEGKITFIDLAGYERFDKTGVKDPIHKDEAKKINASLLSLGHVVTALSNGEKFIPWRNSKLTRLLQDSIGGKSRSTIVITIGPASSSLHETTNSLDFGNRAMAVKVSAKVEQDIDYQKLAAKLELLLSEKDERINKLELAEKTREMERMDRERRFKNDMSRLRTRHTGELNQLMQEGATTERIQALLKQHEVEDQNLQEEQSMERQIEEEDFQQEEREIVSEIEQQHRVRAQSMKREGTESKQRELDAAYALIAKLRGGDESTVGDIATEISQMAGTPAPDGEELASPKTVTTAEVAILKRELEELKKETEGKESKAKETIDKVKTAHQKCVVLLKEQKEKNKKLIEESVNVEELERLTGECEGLKSAKQEATALREETEDKLLQATSSLNSAKSECEKLQQESKKSAAMLEELQGAKEALEGKITVLESEKLEIEEEFNRKDRDREASKEEESTATSGRIQELEEQIAALKQQVASLESALEEMKAAKEELDSVIKQAEENVERLEGEVLTKDGELAACRGELEEEKESKKKRERELEKAVEICRDETRAQAKTLQQEIEDTQATTSLEVSGFKDKIAELTQKLEDSVTDIASLEERLKSATTETETLAAENSTLSSQLSEQKLQGETLTALVSSLQAAGDDSGEREKVLTGETDRLNEQLTETKTQLEELTKEMDNTKAQLEERNEKIQSLEGERDGLNEAHGEKSKEAEELQAKIASLEGEREGLMGSYEDQGKELLTAQGEVEEGKKTISNLEEKVVSLEAAGDDAGEKKRLQDEEIGALQISLQEEGEKSKRLCEELEALNAKLTEEGVLHAAAVTASSGKESELQKELSELQTELNNRESSIKDLEAKNEETEQQLAEANEEIEEERVVSGEFMEEAEKTKQEFNEFKEKTLEQFEELKGNHEEEELKLKDSIEQLEDELQSSTQYQEALETRIKELEEQLSALQGDLTQEKTKAQLEAEELRKKTQEERKSREEETKRLLEKQSEEKESLKAKMEKELEEEKKKVGKVFKYSSKVISQLVNVGQLATPTNAPQILRPQEFLASLDTEEVKQSVRYKVICVGAKHTGKSSIQKCLSHGPGLFKKAPEVVNPTVSMSVVDYTAVDKHSNKGFLAKKSTTNTYFQVWDTPCDTKSLKALPAGCLPITGCSYVLSYFVNHEFTAEAKGMDEVLYTIYANCRDRLAAHEKMKIPLVIMGTRKDLLPNSKDSGVLQKKISEVKKWFREHPLRERFTILDVYLVSCKEWTVISDSRGKQAVTSFSQVMHMLATELHRKCPINPPSLLEEDLTYGGRAGMELSEWWDHNQEVRSEKERVQKSGYKGLLSLLVHIYRLKMRGIWLLGHQEFDDICREHIPQYVVEETPTIITTIRRMLIDRSLILPLHDPEFEDEREGVVVLGISVVTDFISSLMLPTVYLSQLENYTSERPGYLKTTINKHMGFNVEEVWRPDWELLFDGRISATAAPCLLKNSISFKKDPSLGRSFLGCMGCCFKVKEKDEMMDFMPALALRALTPDLESALLSAFTKHEGGKTAATLKTDVVTPWEVVDILREIHEKADWSLLWSNGALVKMNGKWGFVKVDKNVLALCCAGKPENCIADEMKKLVEKFVTNPVWKDGMSLEGLPRLLPSAAEMVESAADLSSYITSRDQETLRGTPYPSNILEDDTSRTRNKRPPSKTHSSSAQKGKLDSNRLSMFEEPDSRNMSRSSMSDSDTVN